MQQSQDCGLCLYPRWHKLYRVIKCKCQLQVRSIMGPVRPDRQTLLFPATMPNKVNNLVSDCLTTPVRVTVGEIGAANQDIQQASSLCCQNSNQHQQQQQQRQQSKNIVCIPWQLIWLVAILAEQWQFRYV